MPVLFPLMIAPFYWLWFDVSSVTDRSSFAFIESTFKLLISCMKIRLEITRKSDSDTPLWKLVFTISLSARHLNIHEKKGERKENDRKNNTLRSPVLIALCVWTWVAFRLIRESGLCALTQSACNCGLAEIFNDVIPPMCFAFLSSILSFLLVSIYPSPHLLNSPTVSIRLESRLFLVSLFSLSSSVSTCL